MTTISKMSTAYTSDPRLYYFPRILNALRAKGYEDDTHVTYADIVAALSPHPRERDLREAWYAIVDTGYVDEHAANLVEHLLRRKCWKMSKYVDGGPTAIDRVPRAITHLTNQVFQTAHIVGRKVAEPYYPGSKRERCTTEYITDLTDGVARYVVDAVMGGAPAPATRAAV